MRDLYEFVILAFYTEEAKLLNQLQAAENNMKKYDFDLACLWNYLKIRIEYRYFKDFMSKLLKNIKYFDNL